MSFIRLLLAALGLIAAVGASADDSKVVADARTAAEWVGKALSSSGYKADFSVASLKEIDRFFEDQAPGGYIKAGGLLSAGLGSRIFALGCYVGEVIRRTSGGEWQGNDKDPQAEINIGLRLKNGAVIWPVQRVMKRFKNGAEDSVHAYGIAVTKP